MVSAWLPISMSSSPFNNHSVTVPRAPIIISVNVTFMIHRFFPFPSKVTVLILFFTFFQFYSLVSWNSKVHELASSLLLFLPLLLFSLLLQLLLLLAAAAVAATASFLHQLKSMVFQWSLGDSMSHQISRTLLCIFGILVLWLSGWSVFLL